MLSHRALTVIVAAALVAASCHAVSAAPIYFDDFSGSAAANLNGTAPDTRPGGETWQAQTNWKADGSKSASGSNNAWLPFTPSPGNVYTVTIDANPKVSSDSDWFALGFSDGNSLTNWHTSGDQVFAWTLLRENDAATNVIQTFPGPDTTNAAGHDLSPDVIGPVELSVVLDTTAANWTVEWFAEGNSLRGPLAFASNPTINYVGFGAWISATGSVDNFSLADQQPVPEPSAWILAVLGVPAAAFGLRWRYFARATS